MNMIKNMGQTEVPQELSDFLIRLIMRELVRENIDGALVECVLRSDDLNGRPVQQIYFGGEKYTAFGFTPIDDNLLVYIDPDCSDMPAA